MSRILIIDEEPGNRLIFKSRFSDASHEVVLSESGAKGLVEARKQAFDLVLVSAAIKSGVSSPEVVRRLKANPGTLSVPVIVFQNLAGDPEQVAQAYGAGCDAYVPRAEQAALDHVVRVFLKHKAERDAWNEERHKLEQFVERGSTDAAPAVVETGPSDGELQLLLREVAAGRPEGILIVDSEGYVIHADRGARDLFGGQLEGDKLGSLAPATGLEAFVRDARTEPREGFRLDLAGRKGRATRTVSTTVVPLVGTRTEDDRDLKVVLLQDHAKRTIAAEALKTAEPSVPRQQWGPLVEASREAYSPARLIGSSESMRGVRGKLVAVAESRGPLLIQGAIGSGKERVARTVHFGSEASGGFVQLHCGGLVPGSQENEIFGYVRGAFDGATADRPGLLHNAHDGTLFLEEFQELTLDLQKRLIEVIEQGKFQRRGSSRRESVDVRLVLSSTADLARARAENRVDPDLLAAISANSIELPPLHERMEDVAALATFFLDLFGSAYGVLEIDAEAVGLLESYEWPGNVAELEDCLRLAVTQADDDCIEVRHLPRTVQDIDPGLVARELTPMRPTAAALQGTHSVSGSSLESKRGAWVSKEVRPWDITDEEPVSLELYEKKALLRALSEVDGDKLAAARLLNVGKSTLYRKLKRFGIT